MTTLMEDLRTLYNDLTVFNEGTVISQFPIPIQVQFSKDYQALKFEQKGKLVYSHTPVYYSLGLVEDIQKPTWLLPEDYIKLMDNLQYVIGDNHSYLLQDRTCVSPENYGFDIYYTDPRELWKGPDKIAEIRFISGTGRFWKWRIKKKYGSEFIKENKEK